MTQRRTVGGRLRQLHYDIENRLGLMFGTWSRHLRRDYEANSTQVGDFYQYSTAGVDPAESARELLEKVGDLVPLGAATRVKTINRDVELVQERFGYGRYFVILDGKALDRATLREIVGEDFVTGRLRLTVTGIMHESGHDFEVGG